MVKLKKINKLLEKKLDSLLELTESINKNYRSEEIIEILHNSLKKILKIDNVAFLVKTKDWKLLLNYGQDFSIDKYGIEKNFSFFKEAQAVNLKDENINFYDFIIPAYHKKELLGVLLISKIKEELMRFSEDKLYFSYITTLVNLTIVALENKKLFRNIKGSDKIKKDMAIAREIQNQLIPRTFPKSQHYEFQGNYIPFELIGGDYYDVIKIDEENIAFCIADVSGKGVSAGMLMSNFQASLKSLLKQDLSLKELVCSINKTYLSITKQLKHVTMFIAKYNIKTRELEFINAGHNYPILNNGGEIIELITGCPLIGVFEEMPFMESEKIIIKNNATLVMYTDGFSEIKNKNNEEFGAKNIISIVVENQNKPLFTLNSNLMKSLYSFKETNKIFDDISLLCAKFP